MTTVWPPPVPPRLAQPERVDVAPCRNLPLTLVFLPASDIAAYVAEGNVDMGITGQDVVRETALPVSTVLPLGFGKCRLSVQVRAHDREKERERSRENARAHDTREHTPPCGGQACVAHGSSDAGERGEPRRIYHDATASDAASSRLLTTGVPRLAVGCSAGCVCFAAAAMRRHPSRTA
jgi:hypothetical protein